MVKHDPPTSEKAYDDNPAGKLKAAQGPNNAGRSTMMSTVAKVAHGVGSEPMHDADKSVMKKGCGALADHSAAGIHKVV